MAQWLRDGSLATLIGDPHKGQFTTTVIPGPGGPMAESGFCEHHTCTPTHRHTHVKN